MKNKFGSILDSAHIVLIVLFNSEDDNVELHVKCRNLAAHFGEDVKIVKIDSTKNEELVHALRIDKFPAGLVYVDAVAHSNIPMENHERALLDMLHDIVEKHKSVMA